MAGKKRGDIRPAGQIRQSQIVTTFGPGAMVDLPDYAVIVGGLHNWREAVDAVWIDYLQTADSEAEVRIYRRNQKVSVALESFTDAEVWQEIQRRKSGTRPAVRGIRDAEIETLLSTADETGSNRPGGDFYARAIRVASPTGPMRHLSRVVKVHRLREVIAQIGFTRFEAAVPDVNGELELGVERAALSLDQPWLPAVENRGEGVFIGIRRDAIDAWQERPRVRERRDELKAGFEAWGVPSTGIVCVVRWPPVRDVVPTVDGDGAAFFADV